jgi:hypothetical protein
MKRSESFAHHTSPVQPGRYCSESKLFVCPKEPPACKGRKKGKAEPTKRYVLRGLKKNLYADEVFNNPLWKNLENSGTKWKSFSYLCANRVQQV